MTFDIKMAYKYNLTAIKHVTWWG